MAKNKNKDDQSNEWPVASEIIDGKMIEMVFDEAHRTTSLAVWDGSQVGYTDKIPVGDEFMVPYSPRYSLVRQRVVLFPSRAEEYGSDNELLRDIKAFIHQYADVNPLFEKMAAHYVLMSWVYERFSEIPYLRALGDWGSGKSRIIQTIGSLCYKPVFCGGATTVSPIFRIINQMRGTLILDEADFRLSDTTAEVIKILNSGYQKGVVVLRTEGEKEFMIKAYNVFCPKIIATREKYFDLALESRFLVEETGRKILRDDIPFNLPEAFWSEALAIRNKCLMWRFRNYHSVTPVPIRDKRLEPRLNQIIAALMSVGHDPEFKEEFLQFMSSYNEQLLADRGMGVEADILRALIEKYNDKREPTIKEVADAYNGQFDSKTDRQEILSYRKVGSIIRNKLQLKTRRKANGIFLPWADNKDKVQALQEKFGLLLAKKEKPDPALTDHPYFGYEMQIAAKDRSEFVNEVNDLDR